MRQNNEIYNRLLEGISGKLIELLNGNYLDDKHKKLRKQYTRGSDYKKEWVRMRPFTRWQSFKQFDTEKWSIYIHRLMPNTPNLIGATSVGISPFGAGKLFNWIP